ncbi:MAG: hypothetical protein ABIJ09_15745 [Pseudomonadota bacterium]
MSTLKPVFLVCFAVVSSTAMQCSAEDRAPTDLSADNLSAQECWDQYLGAALDAGVVDTLDWPARCTDYLGRLTSGACADLMSRVCGADHACQDSPACAAVTLMTEFEDGLERCGNALQDTARYPDCHAVNTCDILVDRTCGPVADGGRLCLGQSSCEQALRLQLDALAPHTLEVCTQALQESSLYPRCSR